MSAARAAAGLSLEEEKRAHEPSMEEILASIRRIIADDQDALEGNVVDYGLEPEAARAVEAAEAAERERIAMLRRLRAATDDPPPPRRVTTARSETEALEQGLTERETDIDSLSAGMEPAADATGPAEPIMSPPTSAAVAAQFERLALSRVFEDSARIDELMVSLLRPMLQQWLDDHLPDLVERLVRAEIERSARGGRG